MKKPLFEYTCNLCERATTTENTVAPAGWTEVQIPNPADDPTTARILFTRHLCPECVAAVTRFSKS